MQSIPGQTKQQYLHLPPLGLSCSSINSWHNQVPSRMTLYDPEYCKTFKELYVAARVPKIKFAYNRLLHTDNTACGIGFQSSLYHYFADSLKIVVKTSIIENTCQIWKTYKSQSRKHWQWRGQKKKSSELLMWLHTN